MTTVMLHSLDQKRRYDGWVNATCNARKALREAEAEAVSKAESRVDEAMTTLHNYGEWIVVAMTAKPEYRDPQNLEARLTGNLARVKGVGVVRVTFERSETREKLLAPAGEAHYAQAQSDALS